MADNLVYEESLNTEVHTSEFISKKWVYVNDNNSQNYTSQVVIDSTPLSNAGGYINWQEGFIVMPLIVQLTSNSIAGTAYALPAGGSLADYSWAFKSGFWNMINSMTVEFNNQNIIQQTPFLNVFSSFKANTSFSLDDLNNEAPTTGFFPDTADSWAWNLSGDSTRYGNTYFTNNVNCPNSGAEVLTVTDQGILGLPNSVSAGRVNDAGSPANAVTAETQNIIYDGQGVQFKYNEGLLKRQTYNNYNPINNYYNQDAINNLKSCNAVYRSCLQLASNNNYAWQVYAKLRLKDLADFFEKMPLLKGSTIRFYINTNQAQVKFNITPTTTNADGQIVPPELNITDSTVTGGLTNPLMIASPTLGSGCSTLGFPLVDSGPTEYILSVAIFKNNFNDNYGFTGASTSLASCRLYAPVYYMNPLAESKYLSLTPTKKIMYKDIFQYQFNGVGANEPFNFLVSNGISNICGVLVVPFISRNQTNPDDNTAYTLPYSSPQNPCSPAPSTPDPISFTNFNVLISGVNLFLNNEMYDYEAFLEQLNQSNQINGGLTTGLASGLINEYMFTSSYRYYYGDASRILPSEQGVSRSVQIVGTNTSLLRADLMVFVIFNREITIDISTGARIE
jgi:hypothetical protein